MVGGEAIDDGAEALRGSLSSNAGSSDRRRRAVNRAGFDFLMMA